VDEVKHICWSDVINKEHPDTALDAFMKLLLPIIDTHAPKKLTVRIFKAPWNGKDGAKGLANRSGCKSDWLIYSKLRNYESKLL
jgi:hypothetical protein